MGSKTLSVFLLGLVVCLGLASNTGAMDDLHQWSERDKTTLRSLWIESLGPIPLNPSNRYAGDAGARALGRRFFSDFRFSGNNRVSCATCHRADYSFTDDLPLAHGMGTTSRRTMPLIGMAYQAWFFWDGRKDSLWSQALGPLESPVEHGFSRTLCYKVIKEHYRKEYEAVFGPFPDIDDSRWPPKARPAVDDPAALKAWISMTPRDRTAVNRVYANLGKAIEAYVRILMPAPARFDEYVNGVLGDDRALMMKTLTPEEVMGLRLFIGKAGCTNCHNGPLFTNGDFHHVTVPDTGPADPGRENGIAMVLADEFNCMSIYSDAQPGDCAELRYIDTNVEKYHGAFKTPTLRNVAAHPPYMHAGRFDTLGGVLAFYRAASQAARHGDQDSRTDIQHADLADRELAQLEAFLHTLSSPVVERTQ